MSQFKDQFFKDLEVLSDEDSESQDEELADEGEER